MDNWKLIKSNPFTVFEKQSQKARPSDSYCSVVYGLDMVFVTCFSNPPPVLHLASIPHRW